MRLVRGMVNLRRMLLVRLMADLVGVVVLDGGGGRIERLGLGCERGRDRERQGGNGERREETHVLGLSNAAVGGW
jgi:hypothetical protein